MAARLFGFPASGEDVSVTVLFATGETWTREFAGRRLTSGQGEGTGRWVRLLRERFGPVRVGTAPVVEGDTLVCVLRRRSLFDVPLPRIPGPPGGAVEREEDGRSRFDVTVAIRSPAPSCATRDGRSRRRPVRCDAGRALQTVTKRRSGAAARDRRIPHAPCFP